MLSATPVDYADLDVPGADPSDDVEPLVVASTPAEVAAAHEFFEGQKVAETKAQVERARGLSRVFSIMQYQHHPETGELMLTQQQIDGGLDVLGKRLHQYAYVWHDSDRLVEVDEGTGEFTCIGLKGLHVHMVLWFDSDARPTVRTVSDAFAIPTARVRVPKEIAAQEGHEAHRGRNAAEKAFFDLAEYLTHESRGKAAIRGVTQPDRYYLTDKTQVGNPGKYQYGRGRVVANFDFGAELDKHMAGRQSAAEGSTGLRARKLKLRRLVGQGEMTLAEARTADFDAYAEDLHRLEKLQQDYVRHTAGAKADGFGTTWRKSTALLLGDKRQGKGLFADDLAAHLQGFAALAGFDWTYVQTPGRNALEVVGDADIVHHDDARWGLVTSYDEHLRWWDPNRLTEPYRRHSIMGYTPAPRAIVGSSTETLESFALSTKVRQDRDKMMENAITRAPVDVDELLFRIGWYVEIARPVDIADDAVEQIRDEMVVSIYRIHNDGQPHRIERVCDRHGEYLGQIVTQHQLEPVAQIKGCERAARFLALSMIVERNSDVVEAIPDEHLRDHLAEQQTIEHEEQARVAELERSHREAAAAEQRRKQEKRIAELEEENHLRSICTCPSYPTGYNAGHEHTCPAMPEEEREAEARRLAERLEKKVTEMRKNGFILNNGRTAS